jgi:hypothetical protein
MASCGLTLLDVRIRLWLYQHDVTATAFGKPYCWISCESQLAAPELSRLTLGYKIVEGLQLPDSVATDEGMPPTQTNGKFSIAQCTSFVILGIPVVIFTER